MARDDVKDPRQWVAQYLGMLRLQKAVDVDPEAADDATWGVREWKDGHYAVVREGKEGWGLPDAVFQDREAAYVAAALFTALGWAPEVAESAVRKLQSGCDDLTPADLDPQMARRIITGLLTKPAALELLLEAMDPDVLTEARSLAASWQIVRGSDKIH